MKRSILALTIMLSGCAGGIAPQQQSELESSRAACDRQFPAGSKPVVPRVRCHNDADLRFIRATSPGTADIAQTLMLRRMAAAERFDRGGMTPAELELEFNRAQTEALQAANARQSQQLSTSAAMIAAGAAIAAPPPPPAIYNCSTWQNHTNCTRH